MSRLTLGVVFALAVFVGAGRADEEKVPLEKLPAKVLDAVKTKFPKADLVSASKEKENNEIIYEVAIKDDGHKIDVSLKEDGTITEYEREIKAEDLPKAVSEGLKEKYGKITTKTTEEVFKKDKLEYYEVLFETADKKWFEVEISAEGKILKQEEKKKKEKD